MANNNTVGTKSNFQTLPGVPDDQKLKAAEINQIVTFQKSPAQQIAGSLDDTDIVIDGTKQYIDTIVVAGSTRTITANASGHFKGNHIIQRYTFDQRCTITLAAFDSVGNNTGTITPIPPGTYDFIFFSRKNGINLEIDSNVNLELSSWYVHATSGNDDNPGTPDFPFTLRQFAIDQTSEGDQIFLRGRPFSNTEVLTIPRSLAILGISRSSVFTDIGGAIILDTSSNPVTLRVENVSLNLTTTGFTKSGANTGNVEFRNITLVYRGDCIFDSFDIRNAVITRVTGNDMIINAGGTIANTFIADTDINFNGTSMTLQDVILEQDLIINSGTVQLEGSTVIKGTITESGGTLVDNREKLEKQAISATLAIPFNKLITKIDPLTITGPTEFTVDDTDAEYGNMTFIRVTADGINIPIYANNLQKLLSSRDYDNTLDTVNIIGFWFDGISFLYSITQPEAIPVPTVTSMSVEDANPNDLLVNISESCTFTNLGGTFRVNLTPRTLSAVSGSPGSVKTFTISGAAILDSDVLDFAYDSGIGDTIAVAVPNNALATFTATTVTNNIALVNTHSMVIDQQGEGMTVDDDNLYFSNGSGTDLPFTILLFYKTPSSITNNQQIMRIQDNSNMLYNLSFSSNKLLFTERTSPGNDLTIANTEVTFATSTWYYIAITKDAGESEAAVKIIIDKALQTNNDLSVGSYTGLPSKDGQVVLQNPFSGATTFGKGKYNILRILDKVLSLSEVQDNADIDNVPVPLPAAQQSNLVAEYRYNENTNATVGVNGSEVGTPTYDTDIPT